MYVEGKVFWWIFFSSRTMRIFFRPSLSQDGGSRHRLPPLPALRRSRERGKKDGRRRRAEWKKTGTKHGSRPRKERETSLLTFYCSSRQAGPEGSREESAAFACRLSPGKVSPSTCSLSFFPSSFQLTLLIALAKAQPAS